VTVLPGPVTVDVEVTVAVWPAPTVVVDVAVDVLTPPDTVVVDVDVLAGIIDGAAAYITPTPINNPTMSPTITIAVDAPFFFNRMLTAHEKVF
jgi:hypothetical protein